MREGCRGESWWAEGGAATVDRWDELELMSEGCNDGSWCATGGGVMGDRSSADDVNTDGAGSGRCICDTSVEGYHNAQFKCMNNDKIKYKFLTVHIYFNSYPIMCIKKTRL